jgi:predicted transcriptional regulator
MHKNLTTFESMLCVLSKEGHFNFLNLVADVEKDSIDSDTITKKLRVTKKEFKSYVLALMSHALIHMHNDQYEVTQLGKEVYDALRIIHEAIKIDWKLKAVDLINESENISPEEIDKMINILVENKQVRKTIKISPSQCVRIKFARPHRTL